MTRGTIKYQCIANEQRFNKLTHLNKFDNFVIYFTEKASRILDLEEGHLLKLQLSKACDNTPPYVITCASVLSVEFVSHEDICFIPYLLLSHLCFKTSLEEAGNVNIEVHSAKSVNHKYLFLEVDV